MHTKNIHDNFCYIIIFKVYSFFVLYLVLFLIWGISIAILDFNVKRVGCAGGEAFEKSQKGIRHARLCQVIYFFVSVCLLFSSWTLVVYGTTPLKKAALTLKQKTYVSSSISYVSDVNIFMC